MTIFGTQNPLPAVNETFITDLNEFLANEDAQRFVDAFNPYVVAGGTHATGAGLTHTPDIIEAYPGGYYTTENGDITYPDNDVTWVIIYRDTTTDLGGNWVNVTGTHYRIDSISATQPTEPANSLILMKVTTAAGAVTVVVDLRNTDAVSATAVTNAVDETDTNATKDKTVSNLLAKGWEDHSTDVTLPFHGLAVVDETDVNSTKNKVVSNLLAKAWEDASNGLFAVSFLMDQIATPATPASGKNRLYFKSDDSLYRLLSTGAELKVHVFPRGHLFGLTLSNGTIDALHDIDVAVGECRSEDNLQDLVLSAIITKQIDVVWAEGSNVGGLFTGTVANDTWYHFFLIRKVSDGTIDAGFDTSVTAANIPSGWSSERRIGSVRTDGSADIRPFSHFNNEFLWTTLVDAFHRVVSTTNPGTSAVTFTITSAPPDIQVRAKLNLRVGGISSGASPSLLVTSLDQTDITVDPEFCHINWHSSDFGSVLQHDEVFIRTDTSAQARYKLDASDANVVVQIWCMGWFDDRGRLS